MKLKDKIKYYLKLFAVFWIRIVFAKRKFKVSILKSLYYNFNGGFTANQVALYNLNKSNKNDYISEFDWYKSRRLNYPNSYMLNNKLICVSLIKDYISTPVTFFKKEKGKISTDSKEISLAKAVNILKEKESSYFKPISVGKGIGIFRIDYKKNSFYINFKKVSENKIRTILKTKDRYFLSSCINQADYINNIYDKTSNTIRLITGRNKKGMVKVLGAVQRIGTKETIPVDNGSMGGLIANINLQSGILSKAKSLHNKNEYERHPDSKSLIEGVEIPGWKEIVKQFIDLTKKLPQFKFIAWDILITNDDVYVLEANSSSGVNIIQVFGGQRNKELGDFYKEYKIIK